MSRMTVEAFAPAKVNLALHVTGRRNDGYHLLDTLVMFGPAADRLTFEPADSLRLTITGPERAALSAGQDNLVMQAARLVTADQGVQITLEKYLPLAAGIGGGSADAAATIRGIADLLTPLGPVLDFDPQDAATLGADVPMCLASRPLRATGIGEHLDFLDLPQVPVVLVNPRQSVVTAQVFNALAARDNPGLPPTIPACGTAVDLIRWLRDMRNDLEAPAILAAPVIADVLRQLRATKGCGLARMSGSGATCFGLFADQADQIAAAGAIRSRHPRWWVAGGNLGSENDWEVANVNR